MTDESRYVGAMAVPCQTPAVMVPTVARFASEVMFGSDVVAERRLSNRVSVQYKLEPSTRSVVLLVASHAFEDVVEKKLVWVFQ